MNWLQWALPWGVLALLLLTYSLADDLPHPRVRRAFATISVGLIVLATVAWSMDLVEPSHILISSTPAAFLVAHHLLRVLFRKWKGEEPTLVGAGGRGDGRFFYEKDARRHVTAIDYLYSFVLGISMLLASFPAIVELFPGGG